MALCEYLSKQNADLYIYEESMYIADTGNNRIVKLNPKGKVIAIGLRGEQLLTKLAQVLSK